MTNEALWHCVIGVVVIWIAFIVALLAECIYQYRARRRARRQRDELYRNMRSVDRSPYCEPGSSEWRAWERDWEEAQRWNELLDFHLDDLSCEQIQE